MSCSSSTTLAFPPRKGGVRGRLSGSQKLNLSPPRKTHPSSLPRREGRGTSLLDAQALGLQLRLALLQNLRSGMLNPGTSGGDHLLGELRHQRLQLRAGGGLVEGQDLPQLVFRELLRVIDR